LELIKLTKVSMIMIVIMTATNNDGHMMNNDGHSKDGHKP